MSSAQRRRILVVEDNRDLRETVAEVLVASGYEVQAAADGSEALARLATSAPPCLILLDLQMPNMDGEEFIARLAQKDPSWAKRTVLMSVARTGPARVASEADAGFLEKPFDMDSLLETVRARCA